MGEYSVYKHTSPSGKVYIGMTRQRPEDRWQNGLGYRNQLYFYRAIQKYGWDAFTHEVVLEGLTHAEAEDMEKHLIMECRSAEKEFGYNIEAGGNVAKVVSEQTIEKLKRTHSTEKYKAWMREKNRIRWSDPEEHKRARERFSGERNPMFGKKRSEEAKAKQRAAVMGAKNGMSKSVCCIETGVVYPSMGEAFRQTGVNAQGISRCCAGKVNRAGGFHWCYTEEV